MRHNRKAVMTEQFKLYLRKHILNGKYSVRNFEIVFCLAVVAVVVACVFVMNDSGSEKNTKTAKDVSVKEALFGAKDDSVVTNGISGDVDKIIADSTDDNGNDNKEAVTTQEASEKELAKKDKIAEKKKASDKEEKSEFDNKCIANVDETLNIRKEANADSDFVGSMNPGAIATIQGTEGEWTKIKSGEVEGYVLSEYILVGKMAEQFAANYVVLKGKALEDGVNVRAEKSTDAEIIKVLEKDDTLTVIEEKEDSKEADEDDTDKEEADEVSINAVKADDNDITWLAVELEDGKKGYVSAEFIDVDKLYEIAVSAEELERQAAEEARRKAAEESTTRTVNQSGGGNSGSDSDSYKGATTTPVTATESGECLGTFKITAYCGCKKCSCGYKTTATGTTPTEGRTIAADTSVLPYGTKVVIGGIVYTVEDCGSGVNGNHIDIFFVTHKQVEAFGCKYMKVYKY